MSLHAGKDVGGWRSGSAGGVKLPARTPGTAGARAGTFQRQGADVVGGADGSALNTLSAGAADAGAVDAGAVDAAAPDAAGAGAAGGANIDTDGDGAAFAPAFTEACAAGAVGAVGEGVAGAVGICGGVGQAVRLAGAPASTGTGVGRIPQAVASASSSTAPATRRTDRPDDGDRPDARERPERPDEPAGRSQKDGPVVTAHSPRKRRPARAAGRAAASV